MTDCGVPLLLRAVRNNASWCGAVCRAHGVPVSQSDELWCATGPSPRFYPNAITMTETIDAGALLVGISAIDASCPRPWALKDSYAELDLEPHGFEVLFSAHWIALTEPPTRRAS